MAINTEEENLKERINIEINSLPEEFSAALHLIAQRNYQKVAEILDFCVQHNNNIGTAYCLMGFCFQDVGKDSEAIEYCLRGKKEGIKLLGKWYYYDVMVRAQNNIDDLQGALNTVDEAIDFFHQNNSPGDVCDHLARKANILKQMAALNSRDIKLRALGKKYIIEAIYSICKSLSINTVEWETLEEELAAIMRVAGRVEVKVNNLNFIADMPHIHFIVLKYFNEDTLTSCTASENFNLAVDTLKKGERAKALVFYEIAYSNCPETTDENRAWKAFVGHQLGLCLLKLNNIENLSYINAETIAVIDRIKSIWKNVLKTYDSLDPNFIRNFDNRFPLSQTVRAIREDRIMK